MVRSRERLDYSGQRLRRFIATPATPSENVKRPVGSGVMAMLLKNVWSLGEY